MWYAAHSGFGNQLVALQNALLLGALVNRTVVVPPLLEHFDAFLGKRCARSSDHAAVIRSALPRYARRAEQRWSDVLVLPPETSTVVYDPHTMNLPAQSDVDAGVSAALCAAASGCATTSGSDEGSVWAALERRSTQPTLLVGSLFHGQAVLLRAAGLDRAPALAWRTDAAALFPPALAARAAATDCLQVRAVASGNVLSVDLRARLRQLQVVRGASRLFVASNARADLVCDHLREGGALRPRARCFGRDELERSVDPRTMQAFSTNTRALLLDAFACTHARHAYHLSSSASPSTLWRFIIDSRAAIAAGHRQANESLRTSNAPAAPPPRRARSDRSVRSVRADRSHSASSESGWLAAIIGTVRWALGSR